MFAPPRSFSQLTTTFFAGQLHRHPPWTLSRLTIFSPYPRFGKSLRSLCACLLRRRSAPRQPCGFPPEELSSRLAPRQQTRSASRQTPCPTLSHNASLAEVSRFARARLPLPLPYSMSKSFSRSCPSSEVSSEQNFTEGPIIYGHLRLAPVFYQGRFLETPLRPVRRFNQLEPFSGLSWSVGCQLVLSNGWARLDSN